MRLAMNVPRAVPSPPIQGLKRTAKTAGITTAGLNWMMKPAGMYAVKRDPTQYKAAHMVVSATSLLVALISITIEQFPPLA